MQLWSATDSDNQKWALKYVGNGYYTLTAKHSGMALNVYGGYYKDGPDVLQYPYTDGDAASMWMLKDAGNGSFYIVNKNVVLLILLSVLMWKPSPRTTVPMYTCGP